jgi:hypothetical protein
VKVTGIDAGFPARQLLEVIHLVAATHDLELCGTIKRRINQRAIAFWRVNF